ncbi:MAG: hypothetical protein JWP01_3710 [Myxococcales bacterium]|nr:hypothetical protein [Myxococcales bacterium]
MLPPDLVAILACPKTKQPLIYFPRGETGHDEADGFLLCPGSRLRYRVDQGVPVMLVEEAEELPQAAIQELVGKARSLGLPVPA